LLASVEFLSEAVPGLRRLGILANVESPASVLEMGEVQKAARKLGLTPITSEVRSGKDVPTALEALPGRVDAVYLVPDALFRLYRFQAKNLAAQRVDGNRTN
jgi:ABC-type uncharacterized transport system substrate-binding protein